MQLRDAIHMIADSGVGALGPTTWADLGCGEGVFTTALASLLAAGSTIHAVDRNALSLVNIPAGHRGVTITTHVADMSTLSFATAALDGILMANSLHYLRDQMAFIRRCAERLSTRRFLIVEYDTNRASRWVPYPVSRMRLPTIFEVEGDASIRHLGCRPSVYQRAPLYAALITA